MAEGKKKRLIVGMSGASGAPLTIQLLRQLKNIPNVESHFIVTDSSKITLSQESNLSFEELCSLADVYYENKNIYEGPASGSFHTIGMIIVPCSMKTLAGIVSGYSDNLLLRAADVTLKERRKLVLCARETPLSTLHLRNLYEASKLGAVIFPPVPAYYRNPVTIEDATKYTVERLLAQFDLGTDGYEWSGI